MVQVQRPSSTCPSPWATCVCKGLIISFTFSVPDTLIFLVSCCCLTSCLLAASTRYLWQHRCFPLHIIIIYQKALIWCLGGDFITDPAVCLSFLKMSNNFLKLISFQPDIQLYLCENYRKELVVIVLLLSATEQHPFLFHELMFAGL